MLRREGKCRLPIGRVWRCLIRRGSSTVQQGVQIEADGLSTHSKSDPTHTASKNAQFRALKPSPALVEYISKQLLGRRRPQELTRARFDPKLASPLDNLPGQPKGFRARDDTVFKNTAKFVAAAAVASSLPAPSLPEVAFAGRSNVGKSSLVNALLRKAGIARTSERPGTTQNILFFSVGSRLVLVDLPGYGFAFASEEKKEQWKQLVSHYVTQRHTLRRVCLLVDSRHGLKGTDEELMNLLEDAGVKYQVILTKADTMTPLDLARRATVVQESLRLRLYHVNPLMIVSSVTGAGIMKLRSNLAGLSLQESGAKDPALVKSPPPKKRHVTAKPQTIRRRQATRARTV